MDAHRVRQVVRALVATLIATLIATVIVALTVQPLIHGQTGVRPEDLILGTWRLVVVKSKYSPGPAPRSETRSYARGPEGLNATVTRVYANGHAETITYLANMDSVNPVRGATEYDTVRLKRITDYESEAVLAHAEVIFGIARRVVSRDGKIMTISFRRESQKPVYNYAVYEKESK